MNFLHLFSYKKNLCTNNFDQQYRILPIRFCHVVIRKTYYRIFHSNDMSYRLLYTWISISSIFCVQHTNDGCNFTIQGKVLRNKTMFNSSPSVMFLPRVWMALNNNFKLLQNQQQKQHLHNRNVILCKRFPQR